MFLMGIFSGILYANVLEWVVHKYVLHGLGKKKGTPLSFHFHEHHKISRKNQGLDLDYLTWGITKESMFLFFLLVLHIPTLFVSVPFFVTLFTYSVLYYCAHRKSHLDTRWARRWLPWHYEHHMGKDQHINWGVRLPIVDKILKTSQY